ncbi:MAG TPA: hypothetical protein VI653_14900 [Steroidobacteraceae bacterium]
MVHASGFSHDISTYGASSFAGESNPHNLFVLFFTTKPGGSGVGSILSRQIAQAYGRTPSLENRHDTHGATATFEIPGAVRKKVSERS